VLILAFDTSGFAGSVALLEGGRVLLESVLATDRRSAQSLAPGMAELLDRTGHQPADVRLVATTVGPGSFTGLRVGVTAAKTFAYAVGAQVIGLSTLEVIAHQVPLALGKGEGQPIDVVLDAQRKDVFLGRFASGPVGSDPPQYVRRAPDVLMSGSEWLATLQPGTIVTGAGLRGWLDRLPAYVVAVGQEHWEPRASMVGELAWRQYQRGRRDDLWKLAPRYLRQSAAEEKAPRG
jgi:tRNA threonylcarbamoyladenosine biosynthesis protein TsaB